MGVAVIDASVLIAALDDQDAHHESAEQAVRSARRDHRLIVPVVAYAEAMVGAIKEGPEAERIVHGFSTRIASVAAMDEGIARDGASIRADHGLPLADALIIASARHLDADVILTADRRWKKIDPRVQVV